MKKTLSLILALALCAVLAIPAFAQDGYTTVSITDGTTSIVFAQGKLLEKDIMLSRQSRSAETGETLTSEAARTTINLIVVRTGSTISRNATGGPISLSFLTRNGSSYILTQDKLELYANSIAADKLFAYPYANAELCRVTLADGKEYYLISGATALKEAPAIPISYTVQPGDNLDAIALNYYAAQGLGDALKAANKEHFEATGGILEAGRDLTLPVTLSGHARLSEPLAKEGETIYIVRSGDTLAGIAIKFYGKAENYTYIYQRNSDRMKNAGSLQVGQALVIPVIA